MKLLVSDVFKFQKEFDTKVYYYNHVKFEEVQDQLHLAMMAELMELCNEIRCFNYWSDKTRSDDEHILSEIADVLSFIFSEGVEKYNFLDLEEIEIRSLAKTDDKHVLTKQFLTLINLYNKIHNQHSAVVFMLGVIELGYMLGYDFDVQTQAHQKKCLTVLKIQEERFNHQNQ